jgi:taurine dioxygenase
MIVTATGEKLGATVRELDLSVPLSEHQIDQIVYAVGKYGVLEFPDQKLTSEALRNFSAQFGKLLISPGGRAQDPDFPEVMILSNIIENGKPLGLPDAGQSWHTDMSYARMIAFANVLYGIKIPQRDGRPLGATQFQDMHAAYAELPENLKKQIDGMTATHDFNKFWDMMRSRKGSSRPPLSEAEKKARPPVSHPVFLTHPISGKKALYTNPGYTIKIDGMPERESDEILSFLFEHQLRPEFHYRYHWKAGAVLLWDNFGTLHNATADYGPDEGRYIKRCQVMATRFFDEEGNATPFSTHFKVANA